MSMVRNADNDMFSLHVTVLAGDVLPIYAADGKSAAAVRDLLAKHPDITAVLCMPAGPPPVHHPKHAAQGPIARRLSQHSPRRHRRRGPRDLVEELRAAAEELFHHVDNLHYRFGWPNPFVEFEDRAYEATQHARMQLAADPDMPLDDMLEALKPVIVESWPETPLTGPAHLAVERIRRAAVIAAYGARNPAPPVQDQNQRQVA